MGLRPGRGDNAPGFLRLPDVLALPFGPAMPQVIQSVTQSLVQRPQVRDGCPVFHPGPQTFPVKVRR